MESAVRRAIADGTLVAFGAAIALGWALFRVANGIGTATACSSSGRSWRRP